ncbi:adenosylcobinamide-phosphate synthase CbiB [Salinisphaera sp. Q1T1-3]|uniref:adenosylcobinamide-phosphate synthase CbiB n=1 Tax=Salinisphaera sp. Q1T1-3 TaxID=2321229 RepID=UPI000E7343CB|nr:adenosylcobinamide-phosphate synthase CbiB [Salinisphaera sp. Q1T1-3]RJS92517.1 cobalamin biosynthesis protein CobD [Salinisphaera sp. Q1T1-3]
MGLSLAILAGLITDALLGEPRRAHPLVFFGQCAERWERHWHADRVATGGGALAALVVPPVIVAAWMAAVLPLPLAWFVVAVLVWLSIGRRSLAAHARPVATALDAGDLAGARRRVAALVSRETEAMDADGVCRATLESVLENSSDAVTAPLVWAALGGGLAGPAGAAAAVVGHRLVNTLDAMWGYRTARFGRFGRVAARLDDLLNWLPARVTALAFAVFGDGRAALACWHRQARACDSPNAGPVMAAGAGALGVRLGGPAIYHGAWRDRPTLGRGQPPTPADIERALSLVDRAVAGLVAVVLLLGLA